MRVSYLRRGGRGESRGSHERGIGKEPEVAVAD